MVVTKNQNLRITKVVDAGGVVYKAVSFLVYCIGVFVCAVGFFAESFDITYLLLFLLFGFLAYSCMKKIRVNAGGWVVDPNTRTLSYPGGGNHVNDMSGAFKLSYWFQSWHRYQINVDDIRQIAISYKEIPWGQATIRNYILQVDGDFGVIEAKFKDKAKRDAIFSALRQITKAGIPIIQE